ncbi:hypothetical protein NEAUS03_1983 [Nematocida ausubeli]|nr:hypothetical protein NEAUS03_1983 [Nematocida ausubeli]
MFERFTIRTTPSETSRFKGDKHFSLLKMLSLDPIQALNAEEFAAWVGLTLIICLMLYLYSLLKRAIKKKILGANRGSVSVEEAQKNKQ